MKKLIEWLKKKSAELYTSVNDLEADNSFYFIDNEPVIDLILDDSFLDSLEVTINNDLILDEIHTKERGQRIEFFGIQLDYASQTKCGLLLVIKQINNGYR